jgi:polyhydroxybutyrate depolymerase
MPAIAQRPFRLATLLVVLGLCGLASPPHAEAAYGRINLTVNGVKRTATLVEFERLKKRKRPVIFVLRSAGGGSGAALRARRSLGLDAFARETGAIVVYPDALGGGWGRVTAGQPAPDDAAFVRALANRLVQQGIASRRRLYIAGLSSGGLLAMKIACENSDLFAGAGAFNAALPVEAATSCAPAQPVSFMLINGTADKIVPYQGGVANLPGGPREVMSSEATVGLFAKAAQCTGKTVRPLRDRDTKDGSKIVVERWSGCKAPVSLVRVEGGGHTVPGRRTAVVRGEQTGAQNNDTDGARMMWDFLLRLSP